MLSRVQCIFQDKFLLANFFIMVYYITLIQKMKGFDNGKDNASKAPLFFTRAENGSDFLYDSNGFEKGTANDGYPQFIGIYTDSSKEGSRRVEGKQSLKTQKPHEAVNGGYILLAIGIAVTLLVSSKTAFSRPESFNYDQHRTKSQYQF